MTRLNSWIPSLKGWNCEALMLTRPAQRSGGFDLAKRDLKMPGMNGIEVLEILKKEHKYLEVIILTGHGSIDSAVESTKLGAFGYLSKPFELDDLLESLKSAYETRLTKKFEADTERMDKILKMAQTMSPLGFLREVKKLDNEEK